MDHNFKNIERQRWELVANASNVRSKNFMPKIFEMCCHVFTREYSLKPFTGIQFQVRSISPRGREWSIYDYWWNIVPPKCAPEENFLNTKKEAVVQDSNNYDRYHNFHLFHMTLNLNKVMLIEHIIVLNWEPESSAERNRVRITFLA